MNTIRVARATFLAALATMLLTAQCDPAFAAANAVTGEIRVLARAPNGDLVAGGNFTSIGGVTAAGIARRQAGVWAPLGSGIQGTVRAVAFLPNGDLVAGGQFATAGGVTTNHIARWDGSAWSGFGTGMAGAFLFQPTAVHALAVAPNGDLIVGGHFFTADGVAVGGGLSQQPGHLARWNGTAWSDIGGGVGWSHLNPAPTVDSIVILANGDLVVAGQFTTPVGRIARWNGAAWTAQNAGWPVSGINQPVPVLRVLPNGDLIAAGARYVFSLAPFQVPVVARWTGSSWAQLGALETVVGATNSHAFSLLALPDGDLLVGGRSIAVAPGGLVNNLVRWNGGTWSAVASGVLGDVRAMLAEPDGGVLVGGNFTGATSLPSPGLMQLVSPCPATVANAGPGCSGSAGPVTLAATTLPWLGGTLRTSVGGMPANSIGLLVTSLSPQTIPLAAILPSAGAGCDGLLQVGLSSVLVPNGGTAEFGLALPDQPSLFGLQLYQYAGILEFAAGNLVALTASNRLVLGLGAF